MKIKKIVKIILNLILILFTSLIFGLTINSSCENIKIRKEINSFKNRGVFQEEMSTETEKFYKVSRETWMSSTPSYTVVDGYMTYGGAGDIVCGLKSNIQNVPGVTGTIEFYVGGHTSSVCFDESYKGMNFKSNYSIESKPHSGVNYVSNKFWNSTDYQTEVICVRVNTSEENKRTAFRYMADQLGKDYNTTFIFNTKNKYYCSDLISRAYNTCGIRLNYDGFYCSILDLMCSRMTYISFYKVYKNGINYYYYLGE